MLISDIINSGFSYTILLQIYGEWFVAYVLGRLSLAKFEELRSLIVPGAIVALVLATTAIFESLSTTNLFELYFADPTSVEAGIMERWGYRRANGPTVNPIYFGVLLYLMMPWVFQWAYSL